MVMQERKEHERLTGLQDPVNLVLMNVGTYECIHLDERTIIILDEDSTA